MPCSALQLWLRCYCYIAHCILFGSLPIFFFFKYSALVSVPQSPSISQGISKLDFIQSIFKKQRNYYTYCIVISPLACSLLSEQVLLIIWGKKRACCCHSSSLYWGICGLARTCCLCPQEHQGLSSFLKLSCFTRKQLGQMWHLCQNFSYPIIHTPPNTLLHPSLNLSLLPLPPVR